MSVNSLLYPNTLELNAQSINLSGISSGLVKVAPIITQSNVLCSNLYVQRAVTSDNAGNIAVPSGPFTITNSVVNGYVLTGTDSTHAQWEELPVQEPAKYLMTDTGSVKIFNSDPPAPGDVLIALSSTEAAWGPQSGGGGSNVASFLDTTGAPVNISLAAPPLLNQYLKSTSATTAIWDYVTATTALYSNVSGYSIESLHSQWSDDANIALTALHANVADLSTISHFADQANWAHTANLAGFAVDSSHSDFADFANAIANTTVVPGNYGDSTHVGRFVVNSSGQLTQASNVAISFPGAGNLSGPVTSVGLATTITATGVTAQKYGNSTSVPSFIVNSSGQLTQAANVAISFPAAGNLTGPVTSVGLATTIAPTGVSAQKYGNSTSVPSFIVNSAGQLTQAANVSISFPAAGNLSGPISSVGLATSITSQTGTGTTFVVQNTPTLTTPNIGAATGTSLNITGQYTTTQATGTAPLVVSSTTKVANLYADRSSLADTVTTNANLTGPIVSVGNATSISSQTGTGTTFVVQTNPSITNPTISQITNTGVLTLPTTTDTLMGRSTTDSMTSKTITDNTNNVISRALWCNSGTGSVSTYASANPVLGYVLTATGTSTAGWAAPSSGGQLTFSDSTFAIYDVTDNTKQIQFNAVGTTGTKTTITSSQTSNQILTLPDLTDTLVGRTTTDSLTNKGISDSTNNVIARSLWNGSGTGSVSVYASAMPTTGQILTATNSTTAAWASPTSFAGVAVSSWTTAGSYTWTINANTKYVQVYAWAGGAGGGSGRRSTALSCGGGSGGGSGGFTVTEGPVAVFGTVNTGYTVVVGAGGGGGAAVSAGIANGNAGTGGGNTTLNAIILATGGTGGYGGTTSFPGYPPAGTGYVTKQAGTAGTGDVVTGGVGISAFGLMMTAGGGGGGGVHTGPTAYPGGKGGNVLDVTGSVYLNGGNGGAVGTNGSDGNTFWTANQTFVGGTGGGGGGGRNTGTAGTGGAGGKPGGGGGGGGGSLNGTSGAGGAGADGAVYIIEYQTAPVTYNAQYLYDASSRATSSSSFVDIGAAMAVTLTTSTLVLVNISTYVTNNTINGGGYLSFTASGATTIAAGNQYQTFNQVGTANHAVQCTGSWVVPVTAGSNTFTLKFATFTGTSTFYYNHISVVPLN